MSEVQSVIFTGTNKMKARRWLSQHNERPIKPGHVTNGKIHYRLQDPGRFTRFRTKRVAPGISFVLGFNNQRGGQYIANPRLAKQMKRYNKREAKIHSLQKRVAQSKFAKAPPTWKEWKQGWKSTWKAKRVQAKKKRKEFFYDITHTKKQINKRYEQQQKKWQMMSHPQNEPNHHTMTNVASAVDTKK